MKVWVMYEDAEEHEDDDDDEEEELFLYIYECVWSGWEGVLRLDVTNITKPF